MKQKIVYYGKQVFPYLAIILIVLLIKKYAFGTVLVNGHSMEDTLKNGDFMILDKMSYRFHEIDRFDIVVVQVGKQRLIKRVIGLPNETISYEDNVLYINGKKLEDKHSKKVTQDFDLHLFDLTSIPEGCYFVMGDNRTDSLDSRSFGVIEEQDILGKANFILYPFHRFGNVK